MKPHTKIYGTIGPACCDTDTLVRLFESGMTGIRINLSHTSLRDADEWFTHIRLAYQRCRQEGRTGERNGEGAGPEILMDLRGPELRIGRMPESCLLRAGQTVYLTADEDRTKGGPAVPCDMNTAADAQEEGSGVVCIPVPPELLPYLWQNGRYDGEILVNDGTVLLQMEEKIRFHHLYAAKCTTLRGGEVKSGKSIAFPGISYRLPTLTESDMANIRLAAEYGVTGVMLPFVRDREDLLSLKRTLRQEGAETIRIFAKIENLQGLERLPELMEDCDEVVIARGDLGNAVPLFRLPVIQAQIASLCREREKPFMVVTQMLASMEKSAVPTRAEVSDIFRAVSEGAASVMLTGETAAGNWPVEAMNCMVNTVREAERFLKH